MVEGNALGDAGFKYLGVSYSVMDCQAFVEKCLSDCGCKKDLAGSNTWYREVMKNGWVGSPEDCKKEFGTIPKGAFLFIHSFDGKEPPKYRDDGLGNASHIGLVTMPRGEGAIHSSQSKGCVCESKFKGKTIKNGGWNKVGLWLSNVSYNGISPEPEPEPEPEPTPEPEPIPEPVQIAIVQSQNNKPVNLRKAPDINATLIDRVPCGDTVEVIETDTDWSKVKWKSYTGYMMTAFLIFQDKGYRTVIRRGSTGYYVEVCQVDLMILQYDIGKTGADGKFGEKTEAAVKEFQRDYNLFETGVVTEDVWAALDEAIESIDPPAEDPEPDPPEALLYTVIVPHLTYYQAEALKERYVGCEMKEERG